jgi:hypothetical protein
MLPMPPSHDRANAGRAHTKLSRELLLHDRAGGIQRSHATDLVGGEFGLGISLAARRAALFGHIGGVALGWREEQVAAPLVRDAIDDVGAVIVIPNAGPDITRMADIHIRGDRCAAREHPRDTTGALGLHSEAKLAIAMPLRDSSRPEPAPLGLFDLAPEAVGELIGSRRPVARPGAVHPFLARGRLEDRRASGADSSTMWSHREPPTLGAAPPGWLHSRGGFVAPIIHPTRRAAPCCL